jgi:hypothetical protein
LLRATGQDAAEAHLDQCELCRFCFGKAVEPAQPALANLPSLPFAVAPVRPLLSGRACLLALLAYSAAALLAVGSVTPVDGLAVFGLSSLVLAMLLAAGLFASAFLLCRISVPGEMLPLWTVAVLPGALLLFVAAVFVLFPLDLSRGLRGDGGCLLFGFGVALGITPLLLLAGWRRRIRDWRVTGPVLGAFAGTTGVLALLHHCPIQEATHLALMHWPVSVSAMAVGAIAGRLVDRSRGWY